MVHHGTQCSVQVVIYLRNTRASSRKGLPPALRRSFGHESSADWPTAPEQRRLRTSPLPARVCSLFYSFYSSLLLLLHVFSYTCCLDCSLGPLFSCLALTLLLFMLLFSSPLFSLLFFFETRLSSSSWIVLLAFFSSLRLVHEFSFVYPRVGGRRILELGAVFKPSSPFRAACRPRRSHFFTNTCPVRILVKSLVAAVISQLFQRPSQCASIGSLLLVAL